jgi:hypothetical protein
LPINAPVKTLREFPYLGFLVILPDEIRGRRKNAGQKYGCINRRQFALQGTAAGMHVEEMEIEPSVSRGICFWTLMTVLKEPQDRQGPIDYLRS